MAAQVADIPEVLRFINAARRAELSRPDRVTGPLPADERVILHFGPRLDAGNEQSRQAVRDYISDYMSGSPERRRRHLDADYDLIDSYTPERLMDDIDFDDPDNVADHIRRFREIAGRLCYVQNLNSDNPEYFAQRYDTPEKRLQFNAKIDFYIVMEVYMLNFANLASFDREAAVLAQLPRDEEFDHILINSLSYAAAGIRLTRQIYEARAGESRQSNEPLTFAFPAQADQDGLRNAGKYLDGSPVPPATQAAVDDLFRVTFDHLISNGSNAKMAKELGIDPLELICINGVSMKERFKAGLESPDPAVRGAATRQIKLALVDAMISGEADVSVSLLSYNEQGHPVVTTRALHPNVEKMNIRKEEDYGFFRRLFDWGPFKCKTRQEKIDARVAASQNAQGNAAINQRLQGRVNENFARNRQACARQKGDECRERLARLSDEYYSAVPIPQGQDPNVYFDRLGAAVGIKDMNRPTTRSSLATLWMLKSGYSISAIMSDTPEIREARQRAGVMIHQMLADKNIGALQEMAMLGAQALANEQMPAFDWRDPIQMSEHLYRIQLMGVAAKDISQIFEPQRANLIDRYGPELYDSVFDNLEKISKIKECVAEVHNFYASDGYTASAEDFERMAADPNRRPYAHLGAVINAAGPSAGILERYQGEIMGRRFNAMNYDIARIALEKANVAIEFSYDLDYFRQAVAIRGIPPAGTAVPARGADGAQRGAPARAAAGPQQGAPAAREPVSLNQLQRERERQAPSRGQQQPAPRAEQRRREPRRQQAPQSQPTPPTEHRGTGAAAPTGRTQAQHTRH
jgi:hypothetical protein